MEKFDSSQSSIDDLKNYSFLQYIKDLAHYISPYKKQFFLGFFFRFTSDLARLYPAIALSQIVALLSKGEGDVTRITQIFIFWGISALYFSSSHNLSKFFGYQVAEKAGLSVYKDTLAHIFKLDFAWQETENSGNKMKRIDKGFDGVNVSVRRIFDTLIEVCVNLIGIVIVFFTLEKYLSLALIAFVIIYFLIGTSLLKKAVKQERVVNKSFEDLGGITYESLNNIQTIKSLSIDSGVKNIVGKHIDALIQEIKRRIFLFQSQSAVLLTYEVVFEFIIIMFLALSVIEGRHDLGLLILFIGLFRKVSESTGELTEVVQQLALAKIWVSRAMAILKTEPNIENSEKINSQALYPEDWKQIKIKNVSFQYKKNEALQNISLTINRGEKVGVVGLSGAGKSTLFKLLLDLYEDYTGEILVGEVPLKNMKRQSFIDHVAVVLQDTELFDMTLKENIEIAQVAGRKVPNNFLSTAVKMAHLSEVVERLPQGLGTVVGEKGIKLSGGQRQRVGIARALFRQPDILLLDEATSHLDAHSEKEIQLALSEWMNKSSLGNLTTIVIAHRLSTIKAMDKIVVLGHGKIIEEGSFDELIKKKGAFAKMWQEQKI